MSEIWGSGHSLILTFLFVPTLTIEIIAIPLTLTLIEFCLIYGLDNLILPLAGAFLLEQIIH